MKGADSKNMFSVYNLLRKKEKKKKTSHNTSHISTLRFLIWLGFELCLRLVSLASLASLNYLLLMTVIDIERGKQMVFRKFSSISIHFENDRK